MLLILEDGTIVNLDNMTRVSPTKPFNDLKYKLCLGTDVIYITQNDYDKIANIISIKSE